MAHIKDDSDTSVFNNSVFDWGFQAKDSGSKSGSVKSAASGEDAPSSRYDPKAMSRIVDINDLVDDSDDGDSDDDAIVGHTSGEGSVLSSTKGLSGKNKRGKKKMTLPPYGPGGIGSVAMCRQVVILVSLVAIIVAASVAIGYAVVNGPNEASGSSSSNKEERKQQQLLETAERVIVACAESHLDEDMGECQKLCRKSMCCFEGGKYGCEDDEKKNCAVYAGCANLLEGIPTDGAEEDEE
mmetsp:Transcript_12447/g.30420  ORF Transcript_12447/g.30420 Transcript_12447/m.30420 type:complete len:240 (+) Transcript_12447:65-784(+)